MTILQILSPHTHGLSGLISAYAITLLALGAAFWARRAELLEFAGLPLRALPVCGVALMCWTIVRSLLAPYLTFDGAVALGTAVLFLGLFGYISGLLPRRVLRGVNVERGALLRSSENRRVRRGVLQLAGIPVPPLDETKHFKCLGTTGTGKSTAIRGLLRGALLRGDRAIIADPDGSYLAHFYDRAR